MIEFDWDADNITHIAEHDVVPEEVEFALTHRTVGIEYQDWHDGEWSSSLHSHDDQRFQYSSRYGL